jgi:MoaA/NifB/PqqE/SkfB family radical SAM enzyme
MGAKKLTLLGGEPTLYGQDTKSGYSISCLVNLAKEIGYEYVRMDTNGIFEPSLLEDSNLRKIDEISFSIDGYDEKTNDPIRGEGSFNKAVENITRAIELGYNVDITSCIHNELLKKLDNGAYSLERFIAMAEELGVNRVNFHALVKDGTPIDTWTGDLQVSIEKWAEVFLAIESNIKQGKYKVGVRIPQTFIKKKDFEKNPEYYGFCPAKLGERVLVHPNGVIRICSGLLCSAYNIADYHDNKISWNCRQTNELIDHEIDTPTPCTNRSKKDYGEYYPLCFSFKPRQDEYVYNDLLSWEAKNNNN